MLKRIFNYHKNNKPCFEINKENLKQIDIPYMVREPICIVEEAQAGYEDPRWVEKSNSIKFRDNYTCQLCHAFNPMLEGGLFIQQGKYKTLHHYDADNSRYLIHVIDYDLDINFNFRFGFHLVMPRLNVHHQIYYRNRDLWDYEDECLITLCEQCHHFIHSLNSIPIFEENALGQTILIGRIQPKPYRPELIHTDLGTFRPFSLVKENRWGIGLNGQSMIEFKRAMDENKKWYDYHDTLNDGVSIKCFYIGDSRINNCTEEETKIVADFIIHDFIEIFLGYGMIK